MNQVLPRLAFLLGIVVPASFVLPAADPACMVKAGTQNPSPAQVAETSKPAESPVCSEIVGDTWYLPGNLNANGPWRILADAEVAKAARARHREILLENGGTPDGLVKNHFVLSGEPSFGHLWLSERAGYVMLWLSTCTHGVFRISHGDVRFERGQVTLIPRERSAPGVKDSSASNAGSPQKYVRFRMNEGELLIPSREYGQFRARLATLPARKRRHPVGEEFWSYFRNGSGVPGGGDRASAHGSKRTPKLTGPRFSGTILAVGEPYVEVKKNSSGMGGTFIPDERRHLVVPMTFDTGSERGLRPGAKLHLSIAGSHRLFKVVSVNGRICRALFVDETLVETFNPDKTMIADFLVRSGFRPGQPVRTSSIDAPDGVDEVED